MDQGLLPRRYAKALYKFAVERGDAAGVYTLMQNLVNAFMATPALQQAIANPFVSAKDKAALITTACAAGKDEEAAASTVNDFVKLLETNRRVDIIRDAALAYRRIYRQANHIYGVEIRSAAPLDDEDRKRLKDMVERHLDGAMAEFEFKVDPEIIGGFVVTIDSERLDASLKGELEKLRQQLLG